jgi:hypothetical protein
MPDRIHQKLPSHAPRARLLAAAALVTGVLIAGCSSASLSAARAGGGTRSISTTASAAESGLAFSKCMRSSGVPNFPDLGSMGIQIAGSGQTISINGVSLNGPAYEAARAKCQKYLPTHKTASPSPQAQAQLRAGLLRFANCMRSHGVPNYPDPKVFSGQDGNQEVYLPGINPYAPAFQTAAKACGGFNSKK